MLKFQNCFREISILFLLLLILSSVAFAQGIPENTDTSRFLPRPEDFPMPGWQVNFEHLNKQSRNILSTSNRGYRFLVNMDTSPETALTFNVTVSLLRPGTIIDQERGVEVANSHVVFKNVYDSSSMGHYMPAQLSKWGDESFEAAKDYDKYRIVIRRGQYLIDIVGADMLPNNTAKPSVKDVAYFFAYFLDSRVFGARIGAFKPMQALDDPRVPMVAGKRMVVYATVEVESTEKFPKNFLLTLDVTGQGFRQSIYQIPLGIKGKTEFGPAGSTDDGSLWGQEYGEPVALTPENKAIMGIVDNPGYTTYLYRYYLDPSRTLSSGQYIFKINITDPTGSKLREYIIGKPVYASRQLRIAVMPLPIGYWSPGKDWKVEDWKWLSKLDDQAWKRESYISFVASLPEDKRENFIPKIVADYLRKNLPTSKGQRTYTEKAAEAREYLMGVMPVAQENLEIYVYDTFPEDLVIEPHPDSIRTITESLDKWLEKHPRFDRVIGVAPGGDALKGGLSIFLDDDAGRQFWYRKKSMVVSVHAPTFQFAHELAQTFGAVDEFMEPGTETPAGVHSLPPINRAVGIEGGDMVTNGCWPAKEIFMGTPLKPVGSIMGKKEPAWIPVNIYNGILKQLLQ